VNTMKSSSSGKKSTQAAQTGDPPHAQAPL
jgi:hypothetical protein